MNRDPMGTFLRQASKLLLKICKNGITEPTFLKDAVIAATLTFVGLAVALLLSHISKR
jgi:hypothetical protein